MKERTQAILERVVADFVRTGVPATSEHLYDTHDFGIKPAMIRVELGALSDEGYLYQEHPSGGRFPTDKAYRFFAHLILEKIRTVSGSSAGTRELTSMFLDGERRGFIEGVARRADLLSVGFDALTAEVFESGLENLLHKVDSHRKEELLEIVRDFEELPDRLLHVREWLDAEVWPQVFVGTNPVTRSSHLSVIMGKMNTSKTQFVVMMVGPKRMDYRRSIRFLSNLCASCEKGN